MFAPNITGTQIKFLSPKEEFCKQADQIVPLQIAICKLLTNTLYNICKWM